MDGPMFGGDSYPARDGRPGRTSRSSAGSSMGSSVRGVPFEIEITTAPTGSKSKPKEDIDFYSLSMERIMYMRNESDGNAQFARHLCLYLCNSVFFILFLLIMMFLPLSMIVVGAIYKDECPRQQNIPVYLIVGGVFGLIRNCMEMVPRILLCGGCRQVPENEDEENTSTGKQILKSAPRTLIDLFMFAWFIAGCVWVYTAVDDFSLIPGQPDYCHYQVFWFAFWMVTLVWIFLGLVILCGCCVLPCVFCLCCKRNLPQ